MGVINQQPSQNKFGERTDVCGDRDVRPQECENLNTVDESSFRLRFDLSATEFAKTCVCNEYYLSNREDQTHMFSSITFTEDSIELKYYLVDLEGNIVEKEDQNGTLKPKTTQNKNPYHEYSITRTVLPQINVVEPANPLDEYKIEIFNPNNSPFDISSFYVAYETDDVVYSFRAKPNTSLNSWRFSSASPPIEANQSITVPIPVNFDVSRVKRLYLIREDAVPEYPNHDYRLPPPYNLIMISMWETTK